MTGECNLPATTQGATIDRSDNGDAQGLKAPQIGLQPFDHTKDLACVRTADLAKFFKVAAGEKSRLGRGQDHTF